MNLLFFVLKLHLRPLGTLHNLTNHVINNAASICYENVLSTIFVKLNEYNLHNLYKIVGKSPKMDSFHKPETETLYLVH